MNKRRIAVVCSLFALASTIVVTAPASANYLTKCTATVSPTETAVTAMCATVKKGKGEDKLRVMAVALCVDGYGNRFEVKDKTPAGPLPDQSTAYCPEGFLVKVGKFKVVK